LYDERVRRLRRPLVFLVLLFVVWTPLVAARIVPDPTWIAGLYDAADGDEIAIAIGGLTATPSPVVIVVCSSAPRPVAPAFDPPVLATLERPSESRGPPLA
jgi:hypothetical protein